MRNPTRLALLLALAGLIPACGAGSTGARGLQGPSGPAGVVINSVSALPPVLVPMQSSIFSVSATDGAGGALTYAWTASDGLLSSPTGNPVTWTAPDTAGPQTLQVTATNGNGDSALAVVAILVSVSPTGPVVSSVNPGRAHRGDDVAITGGSFGATQGSGQVQISGATATVVSWAETAIRVVVPPTAVPGEVVVTVGGQASTPGLLDVLIDDNYAVFTGGSINILPQVVSDGSGGSIVIWKNSDGGFPGIYGQRFDGFGAPQWLGGPLPMVAPPVFPAELKAISDGSGGVIFAYVTLTDIIVQKVDSTGTPLWGAVGVTICAAANDQLEVQLTSDGAGGAIVCWDDLRTLVTFDVFAQRVNAAGVPQWAPDGIPVNQGLNAVFTAPQISADGFGGAILIWNDFRGGEADIYGQRVNGAGTLQWAVNGLLVAGGAGTFQRLSALVADGTGGAFLIWESDPLSGLDIYAQRINGSGVPVWAAGGVALCSATGDQKIQGLILDGAGGAIALWRDFRSGASGGDLYAQRVDGSGVAQWTSDGAAVTTALGSQSAASLISDGSQGAVVVWQDTRSGDADIYAQRLDSTGAALWGGDGSVLSSAVEDQTLPQLIPNGSGGAFVVWQDARDSSLLHATRSYIYGQFVDAAGLRY